MWTPNKLYLIYLTLSAFTFYIVFITKHPMSRCYLFPVPVLIFSIILRCNVAYENLKPIFKIMLKLRSISIS